MRLKTRTQWLLLVAGYLSVVLLMWGAHYRAETSPLFLAETVFATLCWLVMIFCYYLWERGA